MDLAQESALNLAGDCEDETYAAMFDGVDASSTDRARFDNEAGMCVKLGAKPKRPKCQCIRKVNTVFG